MKAEIQKYTPIISGTLKRFYFGIGEWQTLSEPFEITEGYTYYIFRTEEKAWIRHSGKLTKEEKQWVIENETK